MHKHGLECVSQILFLLSQSDWLINRVEQMPSDEAKPVTPQSSPNSPETS